MKFKEFLKVLDNDFKPEIEVTIKKYRTPEVPFEGACDWYYDYVNTRCAEWWLNSCSSLLEREILSIGFESQIDPCDMARGNLETDIIISVEKYEVLQVVLDCYKKGPGFEPN